jgi:G patch domain and KOW motifs-containing protein
MSNEEGANDKGANDNSNEQEPKQSSNSGKFTFSLAKKSKKLSKPSIRVALDHFAAPLDTATKDDPDPNRDLPKEPLVIPVQEDGRKSLQEQARLKRMQQQSIEDQAAIQALQEEAEGGGPDRPVSSSKLVISSDKNTFQKGKSSKDIIDGDKAQLEKDLANLAGDLDVESDAYRKVPIADFGAALLRGMGWEGSQSTAANDDQPNMPRPSRLGLGATPKLLDDDQNLATHSGRRRPRQQHQVQRDEKLRQQQEEYRQKQQAQLATDKQKTLQIGSIVSVGLGVIGNGNGDAGRQRAIVRQLQGVPGLNMVLVQMEGEGEPTKVKKGEIVLLDRSALEASPFHVPRKLSSQPQREENVNNTNTDARRSSSSRPQSRNGSNGRGRRDRDSKYDSEEEEHRRDIRHHSDRYRSRREVDDGRKDRSDEDDDRRPQRHRSEEDDSDRRYSRVKVEEEDNSSKRHGRSDEDKDRDSRDNHRRSKESSHKRQHSRDRNDHNEDDDQQKKRSRNPGSSTGAKSSSSSTTMTWVIPNIRVRIVSDKFGRSQYRQKGVVVDVSYKGTATLRMDQNGQVLQVPERYLETALPKAGGNAIVLSGNHRLAKGRLLERSSTSSKGVIQVFEDMNVLTLSLDDMAEWCGPLDDDLID